MEKLEFHVVDKSLLSDKENTVQAKPCDLDSIGSNGQELIYCLDCSNDVEYLNHPKFIVVVENINKVHKVVLDKF